MCHHIQYSSRTISSRLKNVSLLVSGLLLATLFYAPASYSDVSATMPDFFAEPGRHPFRDNFSANVTEHIDSFSGNLGLSYIDLEAPGNGGLDIKIQRHYNSNNILLLR